MAITITVKTAVTAEAMTMTAEVLRAANRPMKAEVATLRAVNRLALLQIQERRQATTAAMTAPILPSEVSPAMSVTLVTTIIAVVVAAMLAELIRRPLLPRR